MGTDFRELLSNLASQEGLHFLGCVGLDVASDYARFAEWIADGKHAEMRFLERHGEIRRDPKSLEEGVQCALLFALPYASDFSTPEPDRPRVARYARFDDYHKLLRKKLERVGRQIGKKVTDANYIFRVAVDSAPVLERALAAKSQRGFIGKNTCYIHPTLGSLILLGEIFTSWTPGFDDKQEVSNSKHLPELGGCGICNRCQVNCPTGALDDAYQIDSRKCLSYWSIEHRGTVPYQFWPHFSKYWFGCDICQVVCPYTKNSSQNRLDSTIKERHYPPLEQIATMAQSDYEKYFGGTPLTRAKRTGLRRNAIIAMAASGAKELEKVLMAVSEDEDPVIRETVDQARRYVTCGFDATKHE